MSDENVAISNKILGWLSKRPISFSQARNAFLKGETLIECFAYVALAESTPSKELNFDLIIGKTPVNTEALTDKHQLIALGHVCELELNGAMSLSSLYFENPKKAHKERLTFVLGE